MRHRCDLGSYSAMQVLFEILPLILFFVAYVYKDIYFALIVLMIAMPAGFALKFLRTGKVDKMYLWSTLFLLVFGTAALLYRNAEFFYWKPTAFFWALAAAFIVNSLVSDKPLVRRFFDVAAEGFPTDSIDDAFWRKLNLAWIAFFVFAGALNIYVAYSFAEDFWVKFKVFGLLPLSLLFAILQSIWIMSRFRGIEGVPDQEQDG